MCILFIASNLRTDYPLIVAANRDEFFHRPSDTLKRWKNSPIVAGRDMQAGGTWLGFNANTGVVAAVTNIRSGQAALGQSRSRGALVTEALHTRPEALAELAGRLTEKCDDYNPFNLLFGLPGVLYSCGTLQSEPRLLDDGVTSISNGPQDQQWPKMSRGSQMIEHYLQNASRIDIDRLIELMRDTSRTDLRELPKTGIPRKLEHVLSSIFIPPVQLHGNVFGTRATSLILFGAEQVSLVEQTWLSDGSPGGRVSRQLKLPG